MNMPNIDVSKEVPGPFTDPVLRCDSCHILVKRATLHKLGTCPKCGNKRVRDVTIVNSEERDQLKEWGFLEFAAQFEAVPDE